MVSELARAVAAFGFRPEGGGRPSVPLPLIGTGALINDSRGDGTPFFLTARHHFLFGGSGVRLGVYPTFEAVWDYTGATAAAGASRAEVLARLPRSRGAVLLACDEATDSALLRLEEVPPGRVFLGWRAARAEGGELHRLSHPYGSPQTCSRHRGLEPFTAAEGMRIPGAPSQTGSSTCRLYQTVFAGILGPGSSGAPLVTPDLRVVGQLWGVCEKDGVAHALDGAFPHAYLQLRRWLDPLGLGEAPPCVCGAKPAGRQGGIPPLAME